MHASGTWFMLEQGVICLQAYRQVLRVLNRQVMILEEHIIVSWGLKLHAYIQWEAQSWRIFKNGSIMWNFLK